ncbi:MAG TPA: Na+/H+ antiporter subunit E [Pedomonas sp.]|nr:Na+/H+ antiporter subunit E [Pedomonas sp.]
MPVFFRRARAALVLAATFVYDLVASSIAVSKVILSREEPHSSTITLYPLDTRTPWGAALMAYFISLTPGSTCVHIADEFDRLYIHLLNAPSEEAAIARFKRLYERWVLELEQ